MEDARRATPDDIGRVAELCREAQAELAPTRGGAVYVAREARPEPVERGLLLALEDPRSMVMVGTLDGVVVGYSVSRLEELRDRTTLGVIEDLFVEEPARSVGVGEAIMAEVLKWCREAGCAGIDAIALPGNRATKNFFEMNGFSGRLIVMHHRLAADGGAG